jgi:hypothetical protein
MMPKTVLLPNRQHAVGEVPHQMVADVTTAIASGASSVVPVRSGADCLLRPDTPMAPRR